MEIKQLFITSLKSLLVNKVRCLQVMICMMAGVAGVVTLLNICQPMFAVADYIFSQYNSPDTINFSVMTNVNNANRADIEDMRHLVADNPDIIKAVSPHIASSINLTVRETMAERPSGYYVFGVDENYMQTMSGLSLVAGRFFKPMEIDREQKVCVVGYSVNKDLADKALGNNLRIWGENYEVIGVLDLCASDYNLGVLIPYTNLKRMQGENTTPFYGSNDRFYVDTYYIKANGEENISNARLAAVAMLENKSGEMNRDWYYMSASYRYFQDSAKVSIYQTLSVFTMFIVVLLLVGGIGVMNVMLAGVQARTKEIGLRKAFGATNKAIKRQFLTEAIIISLLGGLLGCGLGVVGTYVGCWLTITPLSFLHFSIVPFAIALLVTVGTGVLFGTYPANQAAKMEIVDAINSD